MLRNRPTSSRFGVRTVLAGIVLAGIGSCQPTSPAADTTPQFLSFSDLVTLSVADPVPPPLADRLDALLESPIVNNDATRSGVQPRRPSVDGPGQVVRVALWNIERGLQFDMIRLAFSDPDEFERVAAQKGGLDGDTVSIGRQLRILRDADIIILNEVDLGMKRTDYRDIARELAKALGMNYAFGVEFVEVDRLVDLGLDPVALEDPDQARQMQDELRADSERYKGLHGNAILSRYPIEHARIVRLNVCHDWFAAEKAEISALEKGKRLALNKLFLERIEREVRRGGRMALIADVRVPGLPEDSVSVVDVHLENKCKPRCRSRQMEALLTQIKDIDHPVIIGGDLNTSGADGTPTSIRREIMERVKNYEFWATQALKWATPASLPLLALTPVRYFKNYLDPTSVHLPILAGNSEAGLFRRVERFRFTDHGAFDFRGDTERNLHLKERTLANSNQRARKGFEPTFVMKGDFGGLVGRYKLDWFFIKAFIPRPRGAGMSYRFAPHFPLTMRDLNGAVPDGVSDHAPMTVDLPFSDPLLVSPEERLPGDASDGNRETIVAKP
ncbi:MAG TPA: endonuclease/exonuclease/phosphatase family protein [Bryobacteraceae bacterium]|nr:endonuclease/exonuclease/phosphatase family protein [Bryobacteraceae bacterium]